MNRNEPVTKMDFSRVDPTDIRRYFMQKLDKAGILDELVKQDETGELAAIVKTHVRNLPYPEQRLIQKAMADPFHFANKLDLAINSTRIYSPGGGQLGSTRTNPNVRASEEDAFQAFEGLGKAAQVEAKRLCARHCKKAGRAGCLYCNGIGFDRRVRLGDRNNQPKVIVNGTERILE